MTRHQRKSTVDDHWKVLQTSSMSCPNILVCLMMCGRQCVDGARHEMRNSTIILGLFGLLLVPGIVSPAILQYVPDIGCCPLCSRIAFLIQTYT